MFVRILVKIALFSFLFLSFLFLFTFIYENIPGNPVKLNVTITENSYNKSNTIPVNQFYPNMKFNHNNISYKIDFGCSGEKRKRMIEAFRLVSQRVPLINFFEDDNKSDIEVVCDSLVYSNDPYGNIDLTKKEFFVAGEGGAKEIIKTKRNNIINKGIILLYENPDFVKCDWPNVELHELMHVLGFNHSSNRNSIMYSVLESCEQKLDDSVIQELNRLYSEPNLPDLSFENASFVKKGRYLDFNLTIKNQGDVDVNNVTYTIIEDSKVVETKGFGKLRYGEGLIVQTVNFRLNKRSPKKIEVVLDYFNKVEEIDEKNNIIELDVS